LENNLLDDQKGGKTLCNYLKKKTVSEDRTWSSVVQIHIQWQPWVFVVFIH